MMFGGFGFDMQDPDHVVVLNYLPENVVQSRVEVWLQVDGGTKLCKAFPPPQNPNARKAFLMVT